MGLGRTSSRKILLLALLGKWICVPGRWSLLPGGGLGCGDFKGTSLWSKPGYRAGNEPGDSVERRLKFSLNWWVFIWVIVCFRPSTPGSFSLLASLCISQSALTLTTHNSEGCGFSPWNGLFWDIGLPEVSRALRPREESRRDPACGFFAVPLWPEPRFSDADEAFGFS